MPLLVHVMQRVAPGLLTLAGLIAAKEPAIELLAPPPIRSARRSSNSILHAYFCEPRAAASTERLLHKVIDDSRRAGL